MPTHETSTRTRRQRIERGRDLIRAQHSPLCTLCEIRCQANRVGGRRGSCGLADEAYVYRRLIHLGEELELVPSLTVWMAGCNLTCSFCSDVHALHPPLPGEIFSARALAGKLVSDIEGSNRRVHNINFVGGEPSVSLPFIADVAVELLRRDEEMPPLLLNTNGFLTPETTRAALEIFELFLVDFKFGNDGCAIGVGAAENYLATLGQTLAMLTNSNREVWVRHLLLPGHLDCCTRPLIERLEALPATVRVNLMPTFVCFDGSWPALTPGQIAITRELFDASMISTKYWNGVRCRDL